MSRPAPICQVCTPNADGFRTYLRRYDGVELLLEAPAPYSPQWVLELRTRYTGVRVPIKYCPICGRRLKEVQQ